MPRMTTAEAVLETLLQHGIDTLYALPGVHNDHLFDAAHRAGGRLRVIHTRHEQTAAYMALGAALATGKPQAFSVVPGPGLLNASAALLTAYGMGAPVIALVGQIPSFAIDQGHGHLHEIHDQLGLLRHITRHAARIRTPHEAPARVAEAISIATTGRKGPVALECAIDVWGTEGAVEFPAVVPPAPPPVDSAAIRRAAEILGKAERPLIVAGGGALDAGPEVQAVAEALQAPVTSFRRGRGVIPTTHPLAMSFTEGHALWKDADAVLAIGTRLYWQQSVWGVDDKLPIVRLDIDPEEINRFRHPACALAGDAATELRALLAELPAHNHARQRDAEFTSVRAAFAERLRRLEPQMGFLRAIRAALPEDGIYVEEVTQVGFATRLAFPVPAPRTFLSPGYQDPLGWGYGTALGVQAAAPGRKVVLATGDGGFMYQAGELATAMRHKLPLVVVVFDDGAFGNVRRIQQQQFGNRLIACDLTNPDFVRFAESFGMAAFRADTPERLEQALRQAFALNAPALVHVKVGRDAKSVGHDPAAACAWFCRCLAAGAAMIGIGRMLARLVPLGGLFLGGVLVLACCGEPVTIGVARTPLIIGAAGGRTLEVGPDHALKLPSQAAQVAHDGDTVLIDPGDYDDCAVWRASRLTIAARAPDVVFAGKTCQGKAIFVISGHDVSVRGITFSHAAVPDHNGAGIRAEGSNLTVEGSRFLDNEEGILAGSIASSTSSTIRVTGSEFRGNGSCEAACAHGIYVNAIALLDVEDSRFTDTHEAHDIKSRALRTVLRGNDISDGPTGHASYLVDVPNGGDLLMEHNTLSKGPRTDNNSTAVSIGAEGVRNPTNSLVIRDNSFTNLLPKETAFITNRTRTDAMLTGNQLVGHVVPLVGPGSVQ